MPAEGRAVITGPFLPAGQSRMLDGVEYVAAADVGCKLCAFDSKGVCNQIARVLGSCLRAERQDDQHVSFVPYKEYIVRRLRGNGP